MPFFNISCEEVWMVEGQTIALSDWFGHTARETSLGREVSDEKKLPRSAAVSGKMRNFAVSITENKHNDSGG